MKSKVILSRKAQKISATVGAMAIAAVVGIGGLALTGGAVSAVSKTTTTKPSTSTTPSGTGTTGTGSGSTSTTTPAPAETETPATTPNTGIFTGDGEFTKADGIILVTAGLAVILGGYVVYHNRKSIFRGRVNFERR